MVNVVNLSKALVWALPLSLLSNLGAVAFARKADLTVLPIDGISRGCPQSLTAYETPRPYRPGGSTTDGMVHLSAIATDITLSQVDDFSTVWTGTLKPEYATCKGTAGIAILDGQPYEGNSYIRVQMVGGQARVILDMTGMRDANGFTTQILERSIRDGNPRWAWGGTD